jgi:putative phosphoribosyl transferase
MSLFLDRRSAGKTLAPLVRAAVSDDNLIVLALPRGGVPVAFEVAALLHAPLDVLVVRKLGMPGEEELALGAIASGGVRVLNHDLINYLQVPDELIESLTARESAELERRERSYRENLPPVPVEGRPVVLVDDGLATGATMLAGYRALRARGAAQTIVAVPVAAKQVFQYFRKQVDQIICAATPEHFGSVGEWYENFLPTSDEEVRMLLNESASGGTKTRVHASNIWGAHNEPRKSVN